MKKTLLSALFTALAVSLSAQLKVTEHTLSNGLRVWLNEDHSQPKVSAAVVVNAGAKDTPETGIAHYLEHVMFKGTDRIGVTDRQAEKVILDSISAQYDLLASTTDQAARQRIQAVINGMSVRAAAYAIPNEYDRLITRYGGSALNAYTSQDQTVYINDFAPDYAERWAQIASDRFIDPVFRLFQSELETIYEERNMYMNMMGYQAITLAIERFYAPHPYAYEVIGTPANLKNPRLSEMEAFYRNFYVAGNMGLILSGDFDPDAMLPLLEKTFGRLASGEPHKTSGAAPKPFAGIERFEVKLPVPVIKAVGLLWRGPKEYTFDDGVMDVIMTMLTNDNQTGLSDRRVTEGKLTAVMAVNDASEETGMAGVIAIAKIPFGSESGAAKMILEDIGKIKKGDFPDELLESVKLDLQLSTMRSIESIDSRSGLLAYLFTSGITLDEWLAVRSRVDNLTRKEVMEVAERYFTGDRLEITKKTGKYKPEKVEKPGFEPILPPNAEGKSAYASALEALPAIEARPRLIDFTGDVSQSEPLPMCWLYHKENRVNSLFAIDFIFQCGERDDSNLAQAAQYLHFIGTDSLAFDKFSAAMQKAGGGISFGSDRTSFTVSVTGPDENFDAITALVGNFMRQAKADPKQMKKVVDAEKISRKGMEESNDEIADALREKTIFGANSTYLTRNSLKQVKALGGGDLLDSFRKALAAECDILYTGALPEGRVAGAVKALLAEPAQRTPADNAICRPLEAYDAPQLFFVDRPGASQTIIYGYILSQANPGQAQCDASRLFGSYLSGDMSSILFQEIREFRSMAYGVGGQFVMPPALEKDKPCYMQLRMSTQNDKALEALSILDSLMKGMPVKPERVDNSKQLLINNINNDFPDFRTLPGTVASLKRRGNGADPSASLVAALPSMDMAAIEDFYKANIAGRPIIYMVVGDAKKIDAKQFSKYGKVTEIKSKDLYR